MTNKIQTKTDLLFELHKIQSDALNLQFSLIYNEIDAENSQFYLNKLINTLRNSYNEIKQVNNL
jgi:hypothetical protein